MDLEQIVVAIQDNNISCSCGATGPHDLSELEDLDVWCFKCDKAFTPEIKPQKNDS